MGPAPAAATRPKVATASPTALRKVLANLLPSGVFKRSARNALERTSADSATELEEIARSEADLREQRGAAVASLDEELLELYEDLREQKKGVGVAALVDGVCQGCHQKLSAMELDRLKKTPGVKRCEYCRRILVLR